MQCHMFCLQVADGVLAMAAIKVAVSALLEIPMPLAVAVFIFIQAPCFVLVVYLDALRYSMAVGHGAKLALWHECQANMGVAKPHAIGWLSQSRVSPACQMSLPSMIYFNPKDACELFLAGLQHPSFMHQAGAMLAVCGVLSIVAQLVLNGSGVMLRRESRQQAQLITTGSKEESDDTDWCKSQNAPWAAIFNFLQQAVFRPISVPLKWLEAEETFTATVLSAGLFQLVVLLTCLPTVAYTFIT
jgi:hypothetical protein